MKNITPDGVHREIKRLCQISDTTIYAYRAIWHNWSLVHNGFQSVATPRRGRESVRGNGTAKRKPISRAQPRRILNDTEARGSQRDIV